MCSNAFARSRLKRPGFASTVLSWTRVRPFVRVIVFLAPMGVPGDTVAVDHLSLTAAAGRITVLIGPSGCGKTTSLRMVNRLIEPTSGEILIDGHNVLQEDPTQLRRRIGYVIQQVGLFPHRTIGQ